MSIKEVSPIQVQITLIEEAMKKAGVWTNRTPQWVFHYQGEGTPDIWEWLQFIYLPMRSRGEACPPHLLAPLLSAHLDFKSELQNILQLVIELDSLSPTIETKLK